MAEAGEVPAAQLAETILEVAPPHFGKNIRVRACLPTIRSDFDFAHCMARSGGACAAYLPPCR